jgi:serine-type D-Ala-D-Ala carboxypeptidase/endopeptidase
MKKRLLYILCLLISTLSFGQARHKIKIIDPDTLINRLGINYMKYPESVGLSVGLYYNGEEHTYNYGSLQKGISTMPTKETVYAIGSISKTFISFILAQAVIDKKVTLEDDIRKYLKGDYPNLAYNGKPILLKHLANTTSGLPDNFITLPEVNQTTPTDSINLVRKIAKQYTKQDFFDALHQVKLDTVPGYKAKHSNAAAQLLSFIVEDIYKAPYEELVKRFILKPNAMTNTAFASPETFANAAKGHDKYGHRVPFFSIPILTGSGGMTSTTEDMLKYVRLHLKQHDPVIQLTHTKTKNIDVYAIGLNWLIYKHNDGLSQVWTNGGTYGFFGFIIMYPEINAGIVLLSNSNDERGYAKLSGLADKIFNAIKFNNNLN